MTEPVPSTSKGKPCCTLCDTPLDQLGRPWTRSCGGDCVACLADVGDPECVAAMTAIAAGVGEVPGWQPIETAPNDSREIICKGDRYGRYAPTVYAAQRRGTQICVDGHPAYMRCNNGYGFTVGAAPTHWMPLPAAPTPLSLPKTGENTDD